MEKLIVMVVQMDDVDALMNAIVERGERATHVAGVGGFLRHQNAVVLSCVGPLRVPAILSAVEETCHRRTTLVVPPTVEYGPVVPEAMEVEIGGAVVFVLNVERATFLATGAVSVTAEGHGGVMGRA